MLMLGMKGTLKQNPFPFSIGSLSKAAFTFRFRKCLDVCLLDVFK